MSVDEPSRRAVLGALSALGLLSACKAGPSPAGDTDPAAPTPTRSPEPDPWEPDGLVSQTLFPYGVQTTDPSPGGVLVSVHTTAASVTYTLVRGEGTSWVDVETSAPLTPDAAGIVQLELDGLEADTVYSLVFRDEEGSGRSPAARFRTALAPARQRVVTLGVTSCLGRSNAPWPNLSHAADHELDAFLLLGDTVYADGSVTPEDYRWHWHQALSTQGLLDLTASTSCITTWDDHEVDNDWSWDDPATAAKVDVAHAAMVEAFPHRPSDGDGLFWRVLSWGDTVDLFVLDGRGERIDGRYLSEAQTTWLKEALTASTARFKILLNSVPIADMSSMFGASGGRVGVDKWYGYPEERAELVQWIADSGIEGIFSVGGDIHMGFVGTWDPPGGPGEALWEVTAGPGGSFLNPIGELLVANDQFPLTNAAWNWVKLTLDPGTGEVLVQFVGDDGEVFDETVLAL